MTFASKRKLRTATRLLQSFVSLPTTRPRPAILAVFSWPLCMTSVRMDCYCNFATDISAVEGMSGSPVISAQGEVLGIVTLAGKGKFRGISFGASVQHSSDCLRAEGVTSAR